MTRDFSCAEEEFEEQERCNNWHLNHGLEMCHHDACTHGTELRPGDFDIAAWKERMSRHPAPTVRTAWLIHEWPHSRALGEKWVAHPPVTPAEKPWPGIRFFDSQAEAEAFVGASTG